ncbi:DTW domain containing protein [Shewanella sediminis HAW-EB3]|uniref:tRNA-uridine aminocarboxypropyltransferase n=1 Tax=Shewanella sediminis (strain HAW-EB3) TaxID=425104 RepID=A8FUU4_SHESH|nr:tRNA-uridine aminocarboxypropyltransferase [Shewanella sediminis]ABV36617.1 DTW domain containing protein [Shewanella sediminis HAW-EB3]
MNVILLTHEREVERLTNTGALALRAYPQWCRRIIWSRVRTDKALLQILHQPGAAVLYPAVTIEAPVDGKSGDTQSIEPQLSASYLTELPETLVIIDATWQEARKMLRQSPYLQQANKFALPEVNTSQFKLRRNQVDGGLCTLECIIRLCSLKGLCAEAEYLEQAFVSMNDTHRQ